jgi:hypothetical protein
MRTPPHISSPIGSDALETNAEKALPVAKIVEKMAVVRIANVSV